MANGDNSNTSGAGGGASSTDSIGHVTGGDSSSAADQGNSAGQQGTGNGGNGGDAGFVAVSIDNPTSSSNDASVEQVTVQKTITVAPAIQKASAHFNDIAVALFGGSN
jgi:hypothetical protein